MKKGFRGVPRPLLPAMLLVTNPNAGQTHPDVAPSQPSSSTIPVLSPSSPPVQSPPPIPTSIHASTPTPIPETDPEPMEHTFEEPISCTPTTFTPHKSIVDGLEKDLKQTKLTMRSAIVKLVKKVKKLVAFSKAKSIDLGIMTVKRRKETKGKKDVNSLAGINVSTVVSGQNWLLMEKEEEAKQVTLGFLLFGTKNEKEEEFYYGNKRKEESKFNLKLSITQMKFGIYNRAQRLKPMQTRISPSIATYKIIKASLLKDITGMFLLELHWIVMNRLMVMNGPRGWLVNVCKAMLDKKLQGGKPDEDCYKLLKWMEKQAGIRKILTMDMHLSGGQRTDYSRVNVVLLKGNAVKNLRIQPHLATLKSVLRYVQGTLGLGLQLYASPNTSLVVYSEHTLSRSNVEVGYKGVVNIVAEAA
ncbi:hypothetical protein Tco_1089834 [Tanacetum coccineum]